MTHSPQGERNPITRLRMFVHSDVAGGLLLLLVTAAALIWTNTALAQSYTALWQFPLGFEWGTWHFERSLGWFVNDGVMTIFFFAVGLEIRRELQGGALSQWRRAALPAVAALGGMVAPAVIYLVFAHAPETRSGWGVPMATDIAFAVGILSLLGTRVPPGLRILLLALAVIDDLGAILVIAFAYSSGINAQALAWAGLCIGAILGMQRLRIRSPFAYLVPGMALWSLTYAAGIHPTIAGVALGLLTPARPFPNAQLAQTTQKSPAEFLQSLLHPWVTFLIMPLFALANAGVTVSLPGANGSSSGVALAVAVGLLVGKPLGVVGSCVLALKLRLATAPPHTSFRHFVVLGLLAGIGFTMALFIAQLAFIDATLLDSAKVGILIGSGLAAVIGLGVGRLLLTTAHPVGLSRSHVDSHREPA